MLQEAAKAHPTEWWWLKADGCDVVAGLKESVEHQWSGDVDLNDGKLEKLHSQYMSRRNFIDGLNVGEKRERLALLNDLQGVKTALIGDISFLSSSKIIVITIIDIDCALC